MKVSRKVNNIRRNIMQAVTRNIGSSQSDPDFTIHDAADIKRVLICRPNHRLGNLLLVTPLVQEIADNFPEAKIDLFVKGGLAPIIFKNYPNVDRIISLPKKPFSNLIEYAKVWIRLKTKKYDIAINVDKKSSSGRLSTQWANAKVKFFGDDEEILTQIVDARHIAKSPIYNLRRMLERLGFTPIKRAIPTLDIKLSEAEIENGKRKINKLFGNDKKTICIFTYATGHKCYCEDWWGKFYEQVKARYVDYNILEILPVENISRIDFKAATFYSKDIREIASVIANAEAFIGADSGIMHLASAAKTKTLGLFSVTDETKYEPYNHGSVAVNTNRTSPRDWFWALNHMLVPKMFILFSIQ